MIADGHASYSVTFEGHEDYVTSVCFSPDGELLASGSLDKSVKLWNVKTGNCLNTLKGHESAVRSVCFSPDGELLASGSGDSLVRLWKVWRRNSRGPQSHVSGRSKSGWNTFQIREHESREERIGPGGVEELEKLRRKVAELECRIVIEEKERKREEKRFEALEERMEREVKRMEERMRRFQRQMGKGIVLIKGEEEVIDGSDSIV